MLDRVRTEPRSTIGLPRSILLTYEEEAVRKGEKFPFRVVEQR